jgi:diguanylate cyclase (GGDEF)-like protein
VPPAATIEPSPHDVLELLPTGALVIDTLARVRYANRHVRELMGWDDGDYLGASLFDVIVTEDLGHAATSLAEGSIYYGSVLGPMRMRFIDGTGRLRFTEFWGRELDDRSGYILVTPHGSVIDVVSDAVQAIATGQPVERAVELVVAGFAAYPMSGQACLLRVVDDDLRPMTAWPLSGHWHAVEDTPWRVAARTGRPVDVSDPAELGPLGAELSECGFGALWCRPVIGRRGEVSAVITVFRSFPRPPTANQQHRMQQLVNVAALAFDQLEYRSTLEQAAFTDELTGAATRARLRQELDDGMTWSAVMYLDLDGFKEINDEFGHGAGDAVLAEIGGRLLTSVRSDDLVVRLGGDEFVLVIREASANETEIIASRLLAALAEPCVAVDRAGVNPITLGASVGVCIRPGHEMSFDEAIRIADAALGAVKQDGKGRYLVASG